MCACVCVRVCCPCQFVAQCTEFVDGSGPGGLPRLPLPICWCHFHRVCVVCAATSLFPWLFGAHTQILGRFVVAVGIVETVADSSETLPPKLKLRASPLDLALVDIVDPDQAYSWWSYRDIISWSCPIPNELHLSIVRGGAVSATAPGGGGDV